MKRRSRESETIVTVDALSEAVARDAAGAMAQSAAPFIRSVDVVGAMIARVGGNPNVEGVSNEIIQLFRAKSDDLGALTNFLKPESLKAISTLDGIMNIPTDQMAEQLGHLSRTGPIASLLGIDSSRKGSVSSWFDRATKKADRMIANKVYGIPDELLSLSEIPQVRGQFMLLWLSVDHLVRAREIRIMAEDSVESLLSANDEWSVKAREIMAGYSASAADLKNVETQLDGAIDRGLGLNLAETQHGSEAQAEAMQTATSVSVDTATLQRQFVEQNKVVTRAVMEFHRRMISLDANNADLTIRQGILTAAMLSEHAAGVVVESSIRAIKMMLASAIRTRMQVGARYAIRSAGDFQSALSMATDTAVGILNGAEGIVRDAATKGAALLPEEVLEGEFTETR